MTALGYFTSPYVGRSVKRSAKREALPGGGRCAGFRPAPEKSFASREFFDLPTKGEVMEEQ